jgi:hypothetical protein
MFIILTRFSQKLAVIGLKCIGYDEEFQRNVTSESNLRLQDAESIISARKSAIVAAQHAQRRNQPRKVTKQSVRARVVDSDESDADFTL